MSTAKFIFLLLLMIALVSIAAFISNLTVRFWGMEWQHRRRYRAKERELREQFEQNVMKARLEMQEQTLQLVSREIHDNISLTLTLASLYLSTLEWENIESVRYKIEKSSKAVTKAIDDLISLSHGLNTDFIERNGLLYSLEQEVERVRNTGLFELDFAVDGETVFMVPERELLLFRVIQEGLNNIIRHSNATHIQLHLLYPREGELAVKLADNGQGLEANRSAHKGTGLANMKARIQSLGGRCEIEGEAGKGTTITINIPIITDNG